MAPAACLSQKMCIRQGQRRSPGIPQPLRTNNYTSTNFIVQNMILYTPWGTSAHIHNNILSNDYIYLHLFYLTKYPLAYPLQYIRAWGNTAPDYQGDKP